MRVIFAGTGEIGLLTLQSLIRGEGGKLVGVLTQPDRPSGRGKQLRAGPIKAAAVEAGVPVLQPEKASAPESVHALQALEPDCILVFAYGQILKPDFLQMPRHGCYNVHASLLPRHRGAACIQAAILAGDEETGVTFMRVEPGLDTGAVCLQKRVRILPGETAGELHDRLAQLSPQLVREGLEALEAGQLAHQEQEDEDATQAPRLKKEEGRLDWNQSADELERRIRAFSPWPGTYTFFPSAEEMIRLVLHPPVEVVSGAPAGPPGQVVEQKESGVVVACGAGALRFQKLQRAGKRVMNAAEFLRGNPLAEKTIFQSS